jgi:hypothetical protein
MSTRRGTSRRSSPVTSSARWDILSEFPGAIPVYWDPALGIQFGTGSNVAQWSNQAPSPHANTHLAQASDALRPVRTAQDSRVNNEPTLDFSNAGAAARILLSPGAWGASIPQPFSFVLVALELAAAVGNRSIVDCVGATRSLIASSGTGSSVAIHSGVSFVVGTQSWATTAKIVIAEFNGVSSRTFVNRWNTADASGNPGSLGMNRVSIGGQSTPEYRGIVGYASAGNRLFTLAERQTIFQRLGARFNISVSA